MKKYNLVLQNREFEKNIIKNCLNFEWYGVWGGNCEIVQ